MAHPPTNYLADDIRRIARLHPAEQTAALHDLADRVERYAAETTVTGELDVMATGLDPEQAVRAAAVYATGWPHASHRTAEFWESLAEVEAYIRDGSRP